MLLTRTLLTLLCAFLIGHSPAFSAAPEQEERIQHYAIVEAPKNASAARKLIQKILPLIEQYEKQGKLEDIHEQSYYLEAAVETLHKGQKTAQSASILDAFDESVQIIHYASEHGDVSKLKAELPKLMENGQKLVSADIGSAS